ncbi:MAG: hypothetical protein JO131_05450 [Gammaproteobacteria bacterium]|nr:hypothetical protein [Gammaproteobacteria bacterium]
MRKLFFGLTETTRIAAHSQNLTTSTYVPIAACSLVSAGFIAAVRGPKMLQPSAKPKEIKKNSDSSLERMENTLPAKKSVSDLSFFEKLIYYSISFMSYGACFFSSIANYNFAFSLCETIIGLIISSSSKEEILDYINKHSPLQISIQIFSFLCFSAQMLSFSTQQIPNAKEFLLKWWFHSENREAQTSLFGKKNIFLLSSSSIYILGTVFFAVFSTETGLHNLNNSLFKSLFKTSIPEEILDIFISLSALCTLTLTTTNNIPSNYEYLCKPADHKTLNAIGLGLLGMGLLDTTAGTYNTFGGSLKILSKTLNIDIYNPYLIGLIAVLICPTNFACTFIYNTHKQVYDTQYALAANDPLEELKEGLLDPVNDLEELKENLVSRLGSSVVINSKQSRQEPIMLDDDIENSITYVSNYRPLLFMQPPTKESKDQLKQDSLSITINDSITNVVGLVV